MSHTYVSNRIHVVFSTKERQKSIPKDLQPRLWVYMAGIARNHGFEALKIGGAEDHIHALLLVPPTLPLSKAVQWLKGSSSKWLHESNRAKANFGWQEGYGGFSVSASQTQEVVNYISNQAAHHVKRDYREEFVELLKRYGISYDPVHVLG